jgi:hypothetical protein
VTHSEKAEADQIQKRVILRSSLKNVPQSFERAYSVAYDF